MRQTALKQAGLIVCLIFLCRCSPDPGKRMNNAVERYLAKGSAVLQDLERAFIENISIKSLDVQGLLTNENVLYTQSENSVKLLYPVKRNLSVLDGESVKHAYITGDYNVITDGIQLCIFNGEGDHKSDETLGEKKRQIKSFLISGDNVIYYKDQKLYIYNIVLQSNEPFIKDSFAPPFAQYYAVKMLKKESLMGVIAGIGGMYYFSVVNLANESVIIKNLSLSSFKLSMDVKQVYYISGNTGKWEIVLYNLEQKKKQTVARLDDIVDIELAPEGFLYENKKGIWASEYRQSTIKIPFSYQLAGKYGDKVILKYQDAYYIINMEKMFNGLRKMQEQVPALFAISAE
jgi:hypothetical protein